MPETPIWTALARRLGGTCPPMIGSVSWGVTVANPHIMLSAWNTGKDWVMQRPIHCADMVSSSYKRT